MLPKSPMAEAIGYALNNWSALIRYTEAGFLSIDNNVAEREMKRIAIGRKNWLHCRLGEGRPDGGGVVQLHLDVSSPERRAVVVLAGRAEPTADDGDGATRRAAAGSLASRAGIDRHRPRAMASAEG